MAHFIQYFEEWSSLYVFLYQLIKPQTVVLFNQISRLINSEKCYLHVPISLLTWSCDNQKGYSISPFASNINIENDFTNIILIKRVFKILTSPVGPSSSATWSCDHEHYPYRSPFSCILVTQRQNSCFSVCFPSIEFSIYTLLYLWIYWKYHSWMDSAHDSISREWQVHYNARGVRDICWGFKFIPYDFLSWLQRIQPFISLPIQIESNTHHFSSYFMQQSFKWLNTLYSLKSIYNENLDLSNAVRAQWTHR